MAFSNKVFIATSIDGYIADIHGNIEWLDSIPNPDGIDMGYYSFFDGIDAILMGRSSFEKVLSFGIEWPYTKPVFVLSKTLRSLPTELHSKVEILEGEIDHILEKVHQLGYHNLYIDGGKTIQNFLKVDKIDEMIITIIPQLLGGGISLFGEMDNSLSFECVETKHFLGKIAQNHYIRKRRN